MDSLEQIITVAKTKECWSVGRKYNYAPIDYLHKSLAKYMDELGVTKFLNILYDNYKNVTDPKTFFMSEFIKFDIYVDTNSIIYAVQRAFPEVSEDTIINWMNENREEHHIFIW